MTITRNAGAVYFIPSEDEWYKAAYYKGLITHFVIDNGDAHLKRSVMGREAVVAVTDGRLDFGPWEQIFYGEFDGRRAKRVMIKVIGE